MTETTMRRPDWQCKIVLIGDAGVGKTCILRRYTENAFSPSFVATIGIDFKMKMAEIGEHLIKLQIWDTAGQEKFRSITTAYYRGAKGICIVYDITDTKSFERVNMWVKNIRMWAGDETECMILGNKCDQEDLRQVTKRDGENIAREYNMSFMETSAKNDINVDEAFHHILEKIVEKNKDKLRPPIRKPEYEEIKLNEPSLEPPATAKKCC
ncbi:ras-related protein Rab-10-like [Styela clava]